MQKRNNKRKRPNRYWNVACSTDRGRWPFGPRCHGEGARQESRQGVRSPGPRRLDDHRRDAEMMINARIAQIDHLLSIQLNEVLHHEDFQKLEGSWRGLKYLVDQSETSDHAEDPVMNATKKETAARPAARARVRPERPVQEGVRRGVRRVRRQPFGALIGDYEFGKHPEDIELLERISQVAASAHAPFFSAPRSDMFNLESYTKLDAAARPGQDLRHHRVRQVEELPAVGRFPLRGPVPAARARPAALRPDTKPVEAFNVRRGVDGTDHNKYLWMNAAYAWAPG
jgi:type VI secretion system protein ImpC